MALGQKLGKILGGIGSGLSFVPGPWSAVGVALTAGGAAASAVGAAKDRRDAAREEDKTMQPEPAEPVDRERPQGQPLEGAGDYPVEQPPSRNVFQPQQQGTGMYQDQMQDSIAQMLVRDDGGLYG